MNTAGPIGAAQQPLELRVSVIKTGGVLKTVRVGEPTSDTVVGGCGAACAVITHLG